MEPPHLESEPLFLPADDPETEGLLCVGPREDEVVDLLHHLARYLPRRYFSRPCSPYPTGGRNERASEWARRMYERKRERERRRRNGDGIGKRNNESQTPCPRPARPRTQRPHADAPRRHARAYNMSVVWVWAGPDKGCTVPPFRRRYFPIEKADADAPSP